MGVLIIHICKKRLRENSKRINQTNGGSPFRSLRIPKYFYHRINSLNQKKCKQLLKRTNYSRLVESAETVWSLVEDFLFSCSFCFACGVGNGLARNFNYMHFTDFFFPTKCFFLRVFCPLTFTSGFVC